MGHDIPIEHGEIDASDLTCAAIGKMKLKCLIECGTQRFHQNLGLVTHRVVRLRDLSGGRSLSRERESSFGL